MEPPAVSSQIVRDFALKVATPGSRAMFLDEHNRNTGFASILEASRSRCAFFVEVRDTIVAVLYSGPRRQERTSGLVTFQG